MAKHPRALRGPGRSWAIALGVLVLAGAACIKREAGVVETAAAGGGENAGAEAAAAPTGKYGQVPGVDLLGGASIEAFKVTGAVERVEYSVIDVTGQPFSKAVRAKVKEKSQNIWDVQLSATAKGEVRSGDVMLATFWFRTEYVPVESGEAETEINFELNHEPWDKSLTHSVRAGAEWKQVLVPFIAKRNFKDGEAQIVFRLGYAPQTVEFADVKVENFKKQLTLADLPKSKGTYAGMAADAPWRAQADERIDRLRKADLTVTVTQSGKAAVGAKVTAKLSRHAFEFGTAVPAEHLTNGSRKQIQDTLLEHFNFATLENDLKWEALEDWNFKIERGLAGVEWLRERGLGVRGHVLVWPGWNEVPASLKKLKDDKAKLAETINEHIKYMVTTLKGRVEHWDVVNEPFTNHDILDILGHEVMADWFKLARSLDPKPKLYINDFAILSGGGGTTAHRDHYEKMIQLLVDKGAPFDGIGMQGHFGTSLTSPDDLVAILDRYGKFKKDIAITEFDVVIDDEELAGNYVRDFYTVLFSHPQVKNLTMWGFWDESHWKKNAVMYRKDWTLKPGGQAYKDLVLGKWRTNESGSTDAAGQFKVRGFKGNYDIEVKIGDQTKTVKGNLDDGGSRIDVKI